MRSTDAGIGKATFSHRKGDFIIEHLVECETLVSVGSGESRILFTWALDKKGQRAEVSVRSAIQGNIVVLASVVLTSDFGQLMNVVSGQFVNIRTIDTQGTLFAEAYLHLRPLRY